MDVNLRKKNLANAIRKKMDANYITVSTSDHPLLIKGPDLLIGGDGNLTTIYLPSYDEMRNINILRARYILSRLVFPASTRHVLIQSGDYGFVPDSFAQQFAISLENSAVEDIAAISKDKEFIGKQKKIPDETVLKSRERFSDIYQIIQLAKRVTKRQSWRMDFTRSSENQAAKLIDFSEPINGIRENFFRGETLSSQAVKNLISRKTNEEFSLDDGIPYQKNDLVFELAAIPEVSNLQGDPEKTLRAAAFAGWGILESAPPQLQGKMALHLRNRNKKRNSL